VASILDVAKYIVEQRGPMSAMKLQKLMYYAQSWNLVWEEEPLFDDDFEAWANGPVLPALYNLHRGMFKVDAALFSDADGSSLGVEEKANVDKVLGFYGDHTAQWLSNLTHQEQPWLTSRDGLEPGASSNKVIPKSAMHEYYSAL
jgi:uncharacterized phage-associated protein